MTSQQSQNLYSQRFMPNNTYSYSDEELIELFQEGNEKAYAELAKRYQNRLLNFVFRFVSNLEQAEDIVQDTLVRLYTHKHYYKKIAKFSTWLYTIAGNFAKTELRKRKTRKVTNMSQMGTEGREYEPVSTDRDLNDLAHNSFLEGKIQSAINQLPPHFKSIIILRDIQELSYEEISKIVDVPLGTVKSRINRARIQLQKELKDYR